MDARNAEGRAITSVEAWGIARTIVANANKALLKLDGAPDGALNQAETVSLEAVIHVRGRPSVRVLTDAFEDINLYPEAGMWKLLADEHFDNLWAVTSATAAVHVTDKLIANRPPWVQGTAFLVGPNLALTNRHVLFPPDGLRLARRYPGATTARMKGDYDVVLDFAFDNGTPRKMLYRIVDVLFVADDADPIDAALLRIEPVTGGGWTAPKPLLISRADVFDIDRLYIVGHPGYLENVPEDIMAVFGRPDERKRISFGELMDAVSPDQKNVVHDASTVGGFSGAAVLGFDGVDVRALHYWGDSRSGNRAIPASAIVGHPVLGAMV
ncbi:trypsin-like peptidase domain-containing protein [Rhizobium leguminosarum]|nr:trypsin-like peptidase domain-containing protein [Rhizobium leguminosarum]MBY5863061.1 trypsin-like peptidase domain-containing protein [Rhizobium leguminosarum]